MEIKPVRPLLGVPLQNDTDLHRFVVRLAALCIGVSLAFDVVNQMVFFVGWPMAVRSWSLTVLIVLAVSIPLGYLIGRALLRANRLAARLEALKNVDALTGLPNGRQLRDDFEAIHGQGFVLMIADVDHLCNVNETFGHDAGDEVIARFARIAADELGDLGKLYRAHSDEVVLLATSSSAPIVSKRVLSLVTRLARTDFGNPNQAIFLTISAGIVAGLEGVPFTRAYADAERALANARTAGRNRHYLTDELLPFAGIVESDEISWENRHPLKATVNGKRSAS